MRDTGATHPADEISRAHWRDVSVVPGIDLARYDEDKLVFVALRMRPARAAAGLEHLHTHSDAREARAVVEPCIEDKIFVALRIPPGLFGEKIAPVRDEVRPPALASDITARL